MRRTVWNTRRTTLRPCFAKRWQNREPIVNERPVDAGRIAEFVWNDRLNHPESHGYEAEWIGDVPLVLIWRGAPDHRRVLVAPPESLIQGNPAVPDVHYAFVDAKGHTIAGVKDTASRSVVRTAAGNDLPWTLFVSESR